MTSSEHFDCPSPARGGCGAVRHCKYTWRPEHVGGGYLRCSACARVWSLSEYDAATERTVVRFGGDRVVASGPNVYRDGDEGGSAA